MWEQVQQALNQSMVRVLNELASLVPGVVALIIAMVLSTLLAWILAYLVRRSLLGLRFDDRLQRWGFPRMAEWSPSRVRRSL